MENLVEASITIASHKIFLRIYDSVYRTLAEKPEGIARFIHLKSPQKIELATACVTDTLIPLLSIMLFKRICAYIIPDILKKPIASSLKVEGLA